MRLTRKKSFKSGLRTASRWRRWGSELHSALNVTQKWMVAAPMQHSCSAALAIAGQ